MTEAEDAAAITEGWTGIEMLTADGSRRVVLCGRVIEDVTGRIAEAILAAKRSSRREALGQAAELVEERGRYRPPVRPGQKAMIVNQAIDPTITAAALRALMEAE